MKISGFTFVRNAVKYDYPVIESIQSILPIVDEFIVNVGHSEDGTLELIQSISSPKIRIIHSVWDESLREGGKVFAVETDKALAAIDHSSDWAFYLQADEVVHQDDLDEIIRTARKYVDDRQVEGLLFRYTHFYGTYDYIGDSHRWYPNEIRIIRNNKNIVSYQDAQGFRTRQNKKLKVKVVNARIFHYGWVRHPHKQLEKYNNFHSFWSGQPYNPAEPLSEKEKFDFFSHIDSVALFKGTHPKAMQNRIAAKNWQIDFDIKTKKMSFKKLLLYRIEKLTGRRFFIYRNYRII
jgi:hypothetical protein